MEYHVASLVAYCQTLQREAVKRKILAMPGVEVPEHQHSQKLVVVLEGDSQASILKRVDAIRALTGVYHTNLVYQQVDQHLADREVIQ